MDLYEKFMGPQARRCMNSINENPVCIGTVLVNEEGFPEKTTLDSLSATTYATCMRDISMHSENALKQIDVEDELVAIRMVSKLTEVMAVPDKEFLVIGVMSRTGPLRLVPHEG